MTRIDIYFQLHSEEENLHVGEDKVDGCINQPGCVHRRQEDKNSARTNLHNLVYLKKQRGMTRSGQTVCSAMDWQHIQGLFLSPFVQERAQIAHFIKWVRRMDRCFIKGNKNFDPERTVWQYTPLKVLRGSIYNSCLKGNG